MNDLFSFNRFWNLTREHWTRNWKTVATMVGLGTLGLILILYWNELTNRYSYGNYNMVQWNVFNLGLLFICLIISISWFFNLHDKSRKLNVLMQPCSSLEKTVHAFLWNVLILLATYYLVFSIFNPFLHHWASEYEKEVYQKALPYVNGNFIEPKLYIPIKSTDFNWLIKVLFIQAIILICMLYFKRYAVIKTILFLTILVIVYTGILTKINDLILLPEGWMTIDQNLIKITNEGYEEYYEIKSIDWLKLWTQYNLLPVWILLWIVIHFFIKEQEA